MASLKNGDECRICLSGTEEGEMNTFCLCTNASMHAECLLKWVVVSGRTSCEICQCPYDIRTGRLRACWKWHVPTGTNTTGMTIRILIFVVALLASICNISIFIHSTNVFFKHQALTKWQFLGERWWEVGIGLVFTVLPPVAVTIYTGWSLGPFMRTFCTANRSLMILPKDPPTSPIATISGELIEMSPFQSDWTQNQMLTFHSDRSQNQMLTFQCDRPQNQIEPFRSDRPQNQIPPFRSDRPQNQIAPCLTTM